MKLPNNTRRSWKTLLGGLLAALGISIKESMPELGIVGSTLEALGIMLLGSQAKDKDVVGPSK